MDSGDLNPWAGLTLDLVSCCNDADLIELCGLWVCLVMHCGQRALTVGDTALPCQLCPHYLLSHVTSCLLLYRGQGGEKPGWPQVLGGLFQKFSVSPTVIITMNSPGLKYEASYKFI